MEAFSITSRPAQLNSTEHEILNDHQHKISKYSFFKAKICKECYMSPS